MQRKVYPSDYAIDSTMSNDMVNERLTKAENELVKRGNLAEGNKQVIQNLINLARNYLTDQLQVYRMECAKLPESAFILYSNLVYMATVLDELHLMLYTQRECDLSGYNLFVVSVKTFEHRRQGLLRQQEKYFSHLCRSIVALGLYMLLIDGRQKLLGILLASSAYVLMLSKSLYLPPLIRACYEESLTNKLNYIDSTDPGERAKLKPGLQLTWSIVQENLVNPVLRQPATQFYHPVTKRRLTQQEETKHLESYSSLAM